MSAAPRETALEEEKQELVDWILAAWSPREKAALLAALRETPPAVPSPAPDEPQEHVSPDRCPGADQLGDEPARWCVLPRWHKGHCQYEAAAPAVPSLQMPAIEVGDVVNLGLGMPGLREVLHVYGDTAINVTDPGGESDALEDGVEAIYRLIWRRP